MILNYNTFLNNMINFAVLAHKGPNDIHCRLFKLRVKLKFMVIKKKCNNLLDLYNCRSVQFLLSLGLVVVEDGGVGVGLGGAGDVVMGQLATVVG